MCNEEELSGKTATLNTPWRGYTRIRLIKKNGYRWLVEICGSGAQLEVCQDELVIEL
ncbi:hypothetical protein FACS1894159_07660 [Bacteroidia bacterium]|nr:hypothetical protein FACS1894159_07660 [Bacteroidia bacterium]